MWLPFLLFVALIVWMYHVIAHQPGGQPIGALEAAFAKIGKTDRQARCRAAARRGRAAA